MSSRFLRRLPATLAPFVLAASFACGGTTASTAGDASTDGGATIGDGSQGDTSPFIDAAPTCSGSTHLCAGTCVDTTSDPANCGACGHACTASACIAGMCQPNGLPPDPGGPPGDGTGSVVLAFSKLYLGDTDRNDVPSQTAWKQYGLNLDGKTTDRNSNDVCVLAAGASRSTQTDGANGIDNSWGENILPIFLTVVGSDFDRKNNAAIAAGTFTMMMKIDRLGAQASYSPLGGALFGGAPLGSAPAWNGSDMWPVDTSTVRNGDVTMPNVVFPSSYMNSRVWVSGPVSGRITLPLSVSGSGIGIPIDHAVLSMLVDSTNESATNGVLAGVIPTEEFLLAFKQTAGRISPSLCQGSAFDSVAQQIRQANDILLDGTNHAGVACTGISFGIGFEAKRVKLGSVVTPPTPPNPCP